MKLDPNVNVEALSDEELLSYAGDFLAIQEVDRKEFALHYYAPVNKTIARLHDLTFGTI